MIPILNNGHGGLIKGIYQTKGKQSPNWDKGILFEGAFNRDIINRIIEQLNIRKVPYHQACPEIEDVKLSTRVQRANTIFGVEKNTYYFSLHANAGGGTGIEGFTYTGQSKSDLIAEKFLSALKEKLTPGYDIKLRTDTVDGDLDKESQFYELKYTHCPAFLLECGFMDYLPDYHLLWDLNYRNDLAISCADVMESLYKEGL